MIESPDNGGSIGNLLSSFREAGRLDSHGAFTLAGRKAAGKLAKSLLPDPADWILKIVQCACRAHCLELRISQTHKATHISFRLPFFLDPRALEASLTQGREASQPGINELSTALRVVGLGQDRAWVARFETEEATHWFVVDRGEVSLETTSGGRDESGTTSILLGIAFPPGQSGKVGGLLRFGAAVQIEHEALLVRARACPIPLYLDGARLDNLQRHECTGSLEHDVFLGVAVGGNLSEHPISLPLGLDRALLAPHRRERFTDSRPFFCFDERSDGSGSSLMRFSFSYLKELHARAGQHHRFRAVPVPSRVHLVRHGVVVGKRNIGVSEAISVDVHLNADHETGGLSGLEVEVRGDHLQLAKAEISQSGDFLAALQAALENHHIRPSRGRLAVCGVASGLALALTPLPFNLLAVGASLAYLVTSTRQYEMILADCRIEVASFRTAFCLPEQNLIYLD